LFEVAYDPAVKLNLLRAKLNPIYHLLALLGAYHILHVIRIRVNSEMYLGILVTLLIPELQQRQLRNLWLLQDGAYCAAKDGSAARGLLGSLGLSMW
jgi:hypothetical protein